MDPAEAISQVSSREDLARFVRRLLADHEASEAAERMSPSPPHGPAAGGWENPTLPEFLEALAAYLEDARLPAQPSWQTVAELLAAAKIYE